MDCETLIIRYDEIPHSRVIVATFGGTSDLVEG